MSEYIIVLVVLIVVVALEVVVGIAVIVLVMVVAVAVAGEVVCNMKYQQQRKSNTISFKCKVP